MIKQLQDDKIVSATGVLIGKREQEKLYIYDAFITPNPEKTQVDIKQ